MKTTTRVLLSTVSAAALFLLAGNAQAQYKAVGDDGIAASPKVRQFLEEQKRVGTGSSASDRVVGYQAVGADGIAASPRVRQMLAERATARATSSEAGQSVGYAAVGKDGIAASPKARQMLNEKGATIQVAPFK